MIYIYVQLYIVFKKNTVTQSELCDKTILLAVLHSC